MEQDFDTKHWTQPCPKYDCRKAACKCGLKYVYLPTSLGDDSPESQIAPENGAFCDALVVYEANGHIYVYTKEGIPTLITSDGGVSEEEIARVERKLATETTNRVNGDNTLQREIDDIKNSPDVVDIVATYASLQDYDTSKLGDNDIVRVLQDEEHDGQSTYYRWDAQDDVWSYIGAVGDYYTKGQVNTLLSDKQDKLTAGGNISIVEDDDDLVISAVDTTYNNFVGTDGSANGTAGLVPAPVIADAGKFLKADGTWEAISNSPIKLLTTADFNYPVDNPQYVALWLLGPGLYSVANLEDNQWRVDYVNSATNRVFLCKGLIYVPEFTFGTHPASSHSIYCFTDSYINANVASAIGAIYQVRENSGYLEFTRTIDPTTVDELTSASATRPLSAKQGKVLKDTIDAISNYSTNEVDTGATWVDGKKIYKKTINFGTLPDNTSKNVAHGISNIGYIVKLEGVSTNSARWLPLPLASPAAASTNIMLTADSTNVTIATGLDRTSDSAYVTLYYTKSS